MKQCQKETAAHTGTSRIERTVARTLLDDVLHGIMAITRTLSVQYTVVTYQSWSAADQGRSRTTEFADAFGRWPGEISANAHRSIYCRGRLWSATSRMISSRCCGGRAPSVNHDQRRVQQVQAGCIVGAASSNQQLRFRQDAFPEPAR